MPGQFKAKATNIAMKTGSGPQKGHQQQQQQQQQRTAAERAHEALNFACAAAEEASRTAKAAADAAHLAQHLIELSQRHAPPGHEPFGSAHKVAMRPVLSSAARLVKHADNAKAAASSLAAALPAAREALVDRSRQQDHSWTGWGSEHARREPGQPQRYSIYKGRPRLLITSLSLLNDMFDFS
jgi:membrane protein involved in colicin uptake